MCSKPLCDVMSNRRRAKTNLCRSCYSRSPKLERTKKKTHFRQLGENNSNWKGDKVGYGGLHSWVKQRLIKPEICTKCKTGKALDLANISGHYKRDLSDWEWLCRRCHMIGDGRMKNLKRIPRTLKFCQDCKGEIDRRATFCRSCSRKGSRNPAWKGAYGSQAQEA